jgi:hypothetical protein
MAGRSGAAPQDFGVKIAALESFMFGVFCWLPVHAQVMTTPQRGHSIFVARPSSAVRIQRSILVWQPAV